MEGHREQIELVIVDVTGRNTEKHASLKRLNRFKIPCLLVASERVADEMKSSTLKRTPNTRSK